MKVFFSWMVETYGLTIAMIWWSFIAAVLLGPIFISIAAWLIIKSKRSGK